MEWQKLTSDPSILKMVECLEIEFIDNSPPKQKLVGHVFNSKETSSIDGIIIEFLSQNVSLTKIN